MPSIDARPFGPRGYINGSALRASPRQPASRAIAPFHGGPTGLASLGLSSLVRRNDARPFGPRGYINGSAIRASRLHQRLGPSGLAEAAGVDGDRAYPRREDRPRFARPKRPPSAARRSALRASPLLLRLGPPASARRSALRASRLHQQLGPLASPRRPASRAIAPIHGVRTGSVSLGLSALRRRRDARLFGPRGYINGSALRASPRQPASRAIASIHGVCTGLASLGLSARLRRHAARPFGPRRSINSSALRASPRQPASLRSAEAPACGGTTLGPSGLVPTSTARPSGPRRGSRCRGRSRLSTARAQASLRSA